MSALSVEPLASKEITETSTLPEAAAAAAVETPQMESIMLSSADDTMPNVDVKEKSSKGSYTLPTKAKKKEKAAKQKKEKESKVKTEKKPNFLASIFRHSDRKSKTPALDLPAVERDLNVPGESRVETAVTTIDPLHVPHVDLPEPDVQLPTYDRPEAKLTSENPSEEKVSEFTVPAVQLPPIPDLPLPVDEPKPVELSSEAIKVPSVELPAVQYTSDETEPFVLPELHLKSSKEALVEPAEEKVPELPVLPTVETGLALASPVNDLLGIQVNHSEFPIETDYAVKAEPVVPELPNLVLQSDEKPLVIEVSFYLFIGEKRKSATLSI